MARRRTFAISDIKEHAGNGLLDVLHLSFAKRPKNIVEKFEEDWGVRPIGVVLPVTHDDGLLFEVEGLGDELSRSVDHPAETYNKCILEFAEMGLDIYLHIDPTLVFNRTEGLHIADSGGGNTQSLCVWNERSRQYIAAILGTGIDVALETLAALEDQSSFPPDKIGKLKGVVVDATNIWPMGAKRKRIDLTCFCPSCQNYFEEKKPGLIDSFVDFPSPLNLVLQETATGISHISDIRSDSKEREIIRLSRQRNFIEAFGDKTDQQLHRAAQKVREYMRLRHEQTVEALESILAEATAGLDVQLDWIVITEGTNYDWTSGLLLDLLDNRRAHKFTEIWFDPTSPDMFLKEVPFRSYMWKRSRYYINFFLRTAANITDPAMGATTSLARLSTERKRQLLEDRMKQALGTSPAGKSSLLALPKLFSETLATEDKASSRRLGFIGAALNPDLANSYMQDIEPDTGLQEELQASRPSGDKLRTLITQLAQTLEAQEDL